MGLDGNGNPLWTSDITQKIPVFSDPNGGVLIPSANFNSGINRYLLVVTHTSGQPGGWIKNIGGLGIFDAPEPWGPWTTVEYTDNWMGSTTLFFANFPTKWISPDGKSLYLVYTGFGGVAQDAYQHMKGTLTLSGTTPDTTEPTSPQGLNATAQSETQINLTWQAASDPESGISKYIIYRDSLNIGQSTTTAFSDTGLNEGTTYSYEVSAVNGTGLESAKSTFVSATTIADTTLPTITSVNANGNPSQVIVTFSEPVEQAGAENIINYNIDNGITVSGALLGADLKTVTLSTSPHNDGVSYTLTVNNIKDRASTPNVIAANAQATYIFVAQLVISNLTVASGLNYEVVKDGLQTGAVVYIDRSYTCSSVPALVQGATYIKTANNDKGSSGTSFLTFGVNQDVIVYVAHDDRISTKPSWISSFSDTGDNLVTTDTTFSIFVKDHAAGTITLGGNDGSRSSMYMLVIVGQGNSITDIIPPSSPKGLIIQ
jgi:fibronectin type 3 domain-containing protein